MLALSQQACDPRPGDGVRNLIAHAGNRFDQRLSPTLDVAGGFEIMLSDRGRFLRHQIFERSDEAIKSFLRSVHDCLGDAAQRLGWPCVSFLLRQHFRPGVT